MPKQLVKVSNVIEAEESKIKNQSHVDHICWCEEHYLLWVLVTEPDNQTASLQRDPVVYALLSAQEKIGSVIGQIIAALSSQCTCS